jgi:hypothetical protein
MWKAISTERDTSDLEFVSWRVKAASDDGRERTVVVRIEASTVARTSWTAGKGPLRHVRDAMELGGLLSSIRGGTERRVANVDRLPIRSWRFR